MPNFHYRYHNRPGCPVSFEAAPLAAPLPGPLAWGHNRVAITYPQLMNAALRLGVYPGALWNVDEMNWRIRSFLIAFAPVAAAGGIPAPPAPGPDGPQVAMVPAPGAADLPPSPVAVGVDGTERGQIGYHIGTAAGGHLASCLDPTQGGGPIPGILWFFWHLSRAQNNGGAFNFATAQRPDIVGFSVDPAANWHSLVVWENKGHCQQAGGPAALDAALAQAQSLTHCTAVPGGMALGGYVGGLWPVDAWLASMVDVFHGNFRVQVADPPGKSKGPKKSGKRELNNFLKAYYDPFVSALKTRSTKRVYDDKTFRVITLAKNVVLGLDAKIYRAFRGGNLASIVGKATSGGYANRTPEQTWVDPTGISVELPRGWPAKSQRKS
jgi:hypothetical protein